MLFVIISSKWKNGQINGQNPSLVFANFFLNLLQFVAERETVRFHSYTELPWTQLGLQICFIIKQSWALRYSLSFSKIKMIFCIFYEDNNLFLHQSYLKSSLSVKLTW